MYRTMMKSKLHRAVVTEADLNYVGSITIDRDLMEAVDLWENEKVQVVNNTNGARLETYVIEGPRGSGVICLNGAAARMAQPGDVVIIISYALMENETAREFKPAVAVLDSHNQIQQMLSYEPASTTLD
ncbi:aspartate 1-decarboxylase [Marinococcus halotolerans]|uniref:aspartate 1-decarboxylase n=1 Tax=Marinococcus halotolerans TaxID=301092 RepID=UPI0003B6065C|nr:aspartate 1-decarboxylase [Marinococcus halotolerans]